MQNDAKVKFFMIYERINKMIAKRVHIFKDGWQHIQSS